MTDWLAIRNEYVTTSISYRSLAQEHGVSYNTLQDRAKAEGWVAARSHFRDKLTTQVENSVISESIDRMAVARRAAEQALDAVLICLAQNKAQPLTTADIRNLTASLKELTTLLRDFYNCPTPAQAEQRRINAERLALEKHRLELSEQDDRKIEVVLSDELRAYLS